jgi:hypothetical protein
VTVAEIVTVSLPESLTVSVHDPAACGVSVNGLLEEAA